MMQKHPTYHTIEDSQKSAITGENTLIPEE